MQYDISRTSRLGNREANQDRVTALERDSAVLLVLGDGLGGKAGGEIASQALVDTAAAQFEQADLPIAQPAAFLKDVMFRAHRAIIEAGKAAEPPVEPATTAVLCLVQNGRALWAHTGDSRFYLFRNGLSLYRTEDHSYVEELYQKGQISLDKRQGHPMRGYLTQCLGQTTKVPGIQISQEVALREGDTLLLCSDGLWEPLDDAQIGAVLFEPPLRESLNALAERAEQISYPSSDNISAVVLRVTSVQAKSATTRKIADKPTQHSPSDRLQDAIEEIEQVIEQYRDEMDN
ncbi:MAG: serine/threonine-protein phosphatase [Pseudomonadota bacterium]|nr:MAG: serine/threonine-protein phosphatase [Pseudomonadota bacterium]